MMLVSEFQVEINGIPTKAREYHLSRQRVFHLQLKDRGPIAITMAKGADGHPFWTSIPEGRQEEAEALGIFLSEYLERQNR